MNIQIFIAFFVYFLALLFIGLFFHKKQTTTADFIVGNRSLTFWLTALTAHASDMSAWLFMAFPAAIFIKGVPGIWIAAGLIVGMFCNWQFIAKRLRIETEKYDSNTLSTYFERRFEDKSGFLRVLTAVMSLLFLTIYLGSGMYAMGLLFSSLFGINYFVSLSVSVLVVMTYVFFGGFVTVAWTDFFQGIFLLLVIIIAAFVSASHIPSWDALLEAAHTHQVSLSLLQSFDLYSILAVIFSILSWGLGYYGQPHIVTKFMGIKNAGEITKAKYLGMSWQILSLGAAGLIGFFGLAHFPHGLANPELVFVDTVQLLFSPLFVGLIMCGIIAANMSTMDSQILVCASVLSEDIYKHLFKKEASSSQTLKASRVAVLITSLGALCIAFITTSSILNMVFYAWSGLGSAFGPLVISSLYDKKANRYGAIAGIFVGGAIAALWPLANPYITDIAIPSMIPGFFLGLLAIYGVSRITR